MTTALDLIEAAMFHLRVLQPGMPVEARYSGPMLKILNRRIDAAGVERLTCYNDITLSLAYTANKNQYTVGPGGDFNGQRPDQLRMAWVRDPSANPPQDYPPQHICSVEEWYAIPQKSPGQGAPSSFPTQVWLDPQFPLAVLNVWPMPTVTTFQQFILFQQHVANFAALTTAAIFPPGYEDWVTKDLAIESASLFGKSAMAALEWLADPNHPNSAEKSKERIQANNLVNAMTPQQRDAPTAPRRGSYAWNILTGGPNPN